MDRKQDMLASLRAALDQWERFLAGRTEREITTRPRADVWSIADVVAHMMAWQQVSNARLEAARRQTEPTYPDWLDGVDPFVAEEHVDQYNARIYNLYAAEPWPSVHRQWKGGFLRVIEQAEAIPERELLEADRYSWLKGSPLFAVLEGTRDHHTEHFALVSARQ